MAEKVRPSQAVEVGPTKRRTQRIPIYAGHVDDHALLWDAHAPVDSRVTGLLGTPLPSVVKEASGNPVRLAPFQADLGGYIGSNTKLKVGNIFPYIEGRDDHHPPVDWGSF